VRRGVWVFVRDARTWMPVTIAQLYWSYKGTPHWNYQYFNRGDGWYSLDIDPQRQSMCSAPGYDEVTLSSGNCEPMTINLPRYKPPAYRGWWGDGGSTGV
jgi:hypothetical protein